jgi:hypothetical protein
MLQVSDKIIEPCCVRCFIETLMDAIEIFLFSQTCYRCTRGNRDRANAWVSSTDGAAL